VRALLAPPCLCFACAVPCLIWTFPPEQNSHAVSMRLFLLHCMVYTRLFLLHCVRSACDSQLAPRLAVSESRVCGIAEYIQHLFGVKFYKDK
jgi:hypothetical protein